MLEATAPFEFENRREAVYGSRYLVSGVRSGIAARLPSGPL